MKIFSFICNRLAAGTVFVASTPESCSGKVTQLEPGSILQRGVQYEHE